MKRIDTINVIPFIDIMLVLLAIVLTTASFIATGQIPVNLPEASAESASLQQDPLEISVDRAEQIYFKGSEIALKGLDKQVAKLKSDTAVILRIDEKVAFKRFVSIIDILKRYELSNISIITKHQAK